MGNSEQKLRKVDEGLIHEEKIKVEKKNIRLKFNGTTYNVVCDKDDLFSSVFDKFKNQTGTKDQNLSFIAQGNKLNSEMKLNQINSTNIDVYKEGDLIGGLFPINFTDISKQVHEEHYFSEEAPSYRIVTQGINIYGICKGKKCKAYKKEVIVPKKKIKKFDLIKEKDDLECPECGGIIIPKTLGFHLCKYKVIGKKFINDNDKSERFKIEGRAENKDSIQYFNPDKNGETMVVELKIEVQYL